MLSRIANSLYWLSRYLERADNTARLIEINQAYLLEAEDVLSQVSQWEPLLMITGNRKAYEDSCGTEISASRMIHFLARESANPNSIRSCLRLARENARAVRDRVSKEMWEAMNELWLFADAELTEPLPEGKAIPFFGTVRREVARFHGLTTSTMMRGEAYGFYLLGTHLERADMTARILDVKYHLLLPSVSMVGSALDYYQWAALLKSLSGFEAYRRLFQSGLRPVDVAGFVILDGNFPRSLAFCLDRMSQALKRVGIKGPESRTYQILSELIEDLHDTTPDEIFSKGLHEFLADFLNKISLLSDATTWDYFQVADVLPDTQRFHPES